MIRRVSVPAAAFGLAPAEDPAVGVVVQAEAVDGRLWAAPLGTPPDDRLLWVDCGSVGWEGDGAHRLATAVQAAWAELWA